MDERRPIDIIGVPLDLGVRELGLKIGPDAFREAGLQPIAQELGMDVRDCGNIEIAAVRGFGKDLAMQAQAVARACAQVCDQAVRSIREGRIPVCLGGDHSLAIGSVAAALAACGSVGCAWIDAHPDANTPETSPSGNIHGMPVAILLGEGPRPLVDVAISGGRLRNENMVLLGANDIDPGEMEFIRRREFAMFTVFDILERGLPGVMDETVRRVTDSTDGVHVSLDLDVLHQDVAPGVGLPSSCGLSMREAVYICRRLAACRITSIDIVGLNPVRDRGACTVARAIELLLALLGRSYNLNYESYLRDQQRTNGS